MSQDTLKTLAASLLVLGAAPQAKAQAKKYTIAGIVFDPPCFSGPPSKLAFRPSDPPCFSGPPSKLAFRPSEVPSAGQASIGSGC